MQVGASAGLSGDTREASRPAPQPRVGKPSGPEFQTPARPSMSEMLKDIGSVKLRTIDAVR